MAEHISKNYNPKELEAKWYKYWLDNELFTSKPDSRKAYTMVAPPPNITGSLHLGHALNNTFQDIVIRHKRLQGYNTLWVPGTDHGGIATQNVCEKRLLLEGKRKEDLGREKFLQYVQDWKEEKRADIIGQLQKGTFSVTLP